MYKVEYSKEADKTLRKWKKSNPMYSLLFLIQLPLSAAMLRQFLFRAGNIFGVWSLIRSVSYNHGNEDKENITH